ncbi:MAG: pantoate--beta-alanine ligase [Bacteroidia bacterium]
MQQIITIKDLQQYLQEKILASKKIGFVPTMGALHKGHISLIDKARNENDIVICSIFVNPTQFNDPTDLEKYPRTPESDSELLKNAGCDVLFSPSIEEMYPEKDTRVFDFGGIDKVMEGKFRPGHFNGVAQIVTKLFDLIKPHNAYFGKKDFQQLTIIKHIVKTLNIPVNIIACETVREEDGLAMSSRNVRLNEEERKQATYISKALFFIKDNANNFDLEELKVKALSILAPHSLIKLEYLEIVDTETLLPVNKINAGRTVACIAAFVGNVRLIDNISL